MNTDKNTGGIYLSSEGQLMLARFTPTESTDPLLTAISSLRAKFASSRRSARQAAQAAVGFAVTR